MLAPTNAAFEAALGALGLTREEFLASPALADILTYHVLEGEVGSSDIAAEPTRPTVQGEPVEIAADGGTVTVNGAAKVVTADVPASNGVIHVIDAVLLPPSVAEALGAQAGTDSGMEAGTTSRLTPARADVSPPSSPPPYIAEVATMTRFRVGGTVARCDG